MEKLNLSYIGIRIKQARVDANMTQEQLGELIGKTSRYIQAIENENKGLSLDTLIRIIRVLNLSAEAIIYPEPGTESEKDQWIHIFNLLTRRDRQILLAAAKEMLKEDTV